MINAQKELSKEIEKLNFKENNINIISIMMLKYTKKIC